MQVLLLDDSEVMQLLVGEMLSALGVREVRTAADGERGLALFDACSPKPDVLICDLRMPGMDGIEFIRHVADRNYEGGLILMSGADGAVRKSVECLVRAHGLKLLGVLEKPVEEEALAAALERSGRIDPRGAGGEMPLLSPDEVVAGIRGDRVEVYFQPKVARGEQRLLGVECLARWAHPQRGILPPAAFIPVVERHGLFEEFTLAVFRKAVAQQAAWRRQGHAVKLNINISPDNLRQLDLPETLDGIVRDAGGEPGEIVLEMIESQVMQNLKLGLDVLIRLRLKGFGLSLDDFGTGYSTMESLKQLPFTELKVDRSFVHRVSEDPAAQAILESSIRLGRTLGLNVVVEGVETREDWEAVVAAGCDEVQGYFIARPMPGTEVAGWTKDWEDNHERKESMADKATILVVDDDGTTQEFFVAMLGDHYRLRTAASGEEALAAIANERPDLVLLDVDMPPGIDGYETCRRLKADSDTAEIPVIFVSGCDSLENRLEGYEAGGEDYVVKPFDDQELEAKVAHLLTAAAERADLKQLASYASTTAMTAMTSMNEMGTLLEAMRHFGACTSQRELADAILAGLALYGLEGATQIRSAEGILTRTGQGESSPLEVSVINHMVGMDRIVHFKSRMSIVYQRVSLLIHNMPSDDPDRCGRLRDHLAMLVEGADVRAEAIAAAAESRRRGAAIERAINGITVTLQDIDRAQRESRAAERLAVENVTQRMESAFISVALSTQQEDYMGGVLKDCLEELLGMQSGFSGLQDRLSSIVHEIRSMSA